MATLAKKIEVESKTRSCSTSRDAAAGPDRVRIGCIRLFWSESKTVLIVDIDDRTVRTRTRRRGGIGHTSRIRSRTRRRGRETRRAARGYAPCGREIHDVSTNVAGAIYGTITWAAARARGASRDVRRNDRAFVLALLLYWVAHAYAQRRRSGSVRRAPDGQGLHERAHARGPRPGGRGGALFALVIFGIAGATLSDAVTAGIWTAAALIAAIETVAAIRAG